MWMDRGQVVREYKQAKNKRMQIGILAELNNCYKEEIVKILVEEGILEKPVKKDKKERRGNRSGSSEREKNLLFTIHYGFSGKQNVRSRRKNKNLRSRVHRVGRFYQKRRS